MSRLEDMFRTERDSFDEKDPPLGHLDRFRQRLEQQAKPRVLYSVKFWLATAASLALLFSAGWLAWYNGLWSTSAPRITTGIAEFREAESFYRQMLNEKMLQLESIEVADPALKTKMLQEIGSPDPADELIHQDLKEDPGNEIVMHAIIDQYQVRINMVNKLIDQLRPITNHINTLSNGNPQSTF